MLKTALFLIPLYIAHHLSLLEIPPDALYYYHQGCNLIDKNLYEEQELGKNLHPAVTS